MADTKLSKSAGEHYVCFQMARRGWAVSLTRDGIARTDALASHPSGLMVQVQVKSSTTWGRPSWSVGEVAPAVHAGEWYVLLALPPIDSEALPRAFVIPRDHVAAVAHVGWSAWRFDPAHEGKRQTPERQARLHVGDCERYEDRWDLLLHPTAEVPNMLPDWVYERRKEFPLVANHPWAGSRIPRPK